MVRVELLELVVSAKKSFMAGKLKEAAESWSKIYDIVEKLEQTEDKEKVMYEYHKTMSLFSDTEVYEITDYLKMKAGY